MIGNYQLIIMMPHVGCILREPTPTNNVIINSRSHRCHKYALQLLLRYLTPLKN